MTEVPQIRVEATMVEPADDMMFTHENHSQDGWLSVPKITTNNNCFLPETQAGSAHLLNEHSPQPWLGTLYITAVTLTTRKRPIQHELVWVQVYRKYPSVGCRIGLRNSENQSYALFFPAIIGSKCVTSTSPNPCATPLLCLNLRHAIVAPIDRKRFSLITHSGDRCSLHAEITDEGDLEYWLSVFQQNVKQHSFASYSFMQNELTVRSAPSSPDQRRRLPLANGYTFGSPCREHDSMEPLNDIIEDEDNE